MHTSFTFSDYEEPVPRPVKTFTPGILKKEGSKYYHRQGSTGEGIIVQQIFMLVKNRQIECLKFFIFSHTGF